MEATRWLVTTTKRWPKGTSVDRIKELFPWTPPCELTLKNNNTAQSRTKHTPIRSSVCEENDGVDRAPFPTSRGHSKWPHWYAHPLRVLKYDIFGTSSLRMCSCSRSLAEATLVWFTKVFYRSLVDHEIMVVKQCEREMLWKEVLLLQHAAGPHVTTMFGISTSGVPTLFLEKMAGTLDMLVHHPEQGFRFHITQGLPFVMKLSLAIQVVLGITTAHCSNIVHGDLKLNNFLVDSHFLILPEEGVRGACYYWAPELQSRGAMSTLESDVYSTGLILFEIFMEALPFGTLDLQTVMHEVARGYRPDVPYSVSCPHSLNHCIATTPFLLANLITSCWHQDPCQRPHITSVLAGLKALATP
ncbi:hypothetical protein Pelo_5154 [Pelomyxa schiedti]|nr:hypothetical protein Pelo_5154 [Pelomyxa schiedti]